VPAVQLADAEIVERSRLPRRVAERLVDGERLASPRDGGVVRAARGSDLAERVQRRPQSGGAILAQRGQQLLEGLLGLSERTLLLERLGILEPLLPALRCRGQGEQREVDQGMAAAPHRGGSCGQIPAASIDQGKDIDGSRGSTDPAVSSPRKPRICTAGAADTVTLDPAGTATPDKYSEISREISVLAGI